MDQEGEREGGAAWSNLQIGRVVNAHQVCLLSRQSEAVGIYCTENSGLEIEGNLFLLIRFGQTGPEMQQAIYQMSMRLSISPSLYCLSQFSFHKAGTNKKEVWTAV